MINIRGGVQRREEKTEEKIETDVLKLNLFFFCCLFLFFTFLLALHAYIVCVVVVLCCGV